MRTFAGKPRRWMVWCVALLGLSTLPALRFVSAAVVQRSAEAYRLPADQVLDDDLVVFAKEVYIDGTVNGDVVAAGEYVEVSGVVTGDAMLAAAAVNIKGEVKDDARVAGGGVRISGQIGDDLFAAGGGRSRWYKDERVPPGVWMTNSAAVGGNAYVGAGETELSGQVAHDLYAGAGSITLGGQVGRDAFLDSDHLVVHETTYVADTLTYYSDQPIATPESVAGKVEYKERQAEQSAVTSRFNAWRIYRTVAVLLGFGLLGSAVLRFAPGVVSRPIREIEANPGLAAAYGVLGTAGAVFAASCVAAFVAMVFWGIVPWMATLFLWVGAVILLWTLSPLITGLWLGKRLAGLDAGAKPDLRTLVLGVGVVVVVGRVPVVGPIVYAFSFLFALGGLILSCRRVRPEAEVAGPSSA